MRPQIVTVSPDYRGLIATGFAALQVDDPAEETLEALGTALSLARGRELYAQGDAADAWYQVASGALRTYKLLADGRCQIGAFLLPGDFFGFEATPEHGFGAEAVTSATVIRYSRVRLVALAGENTRLSHRILEITLRQLTDTQGRLLLLGRKTAGERIASFILNMLERSADHETINLPMSRSDIADYLGLTIETVSRTFSSLKQEGIIALPNAHRIVVLDTEALQDLDGGE